MDQGERRRHENQDECEGRNQDHAAIRKRVKDRLRAPREKTKAKGGHHENQDECESRIETNSSLLNQGQRHGGNDGRTQQGDEQERGNKNLRKESSHENQDACEGRY
jgi:hypothetical protein